MSRKGNMHIIVRHNAVTGHRYVLTDGRNDRIFKDAESAKLEAKRLQGWGSAHGVEIYDCFKSTRQAREYCRLRGEGLHQDVAILMARETTP